MSKFKEEMPKGYTHGYKQERLSNVPVAVPLGMKKPESLQDMLSRLVANKFVDLQLSNDQESFEEADDFEVDDDFDPSSPWEEVFDKFGNSLGFVDQNRYQPAKLYERNLDDREQKPIVGENIESDKRDSKGSVTSSDGERS